MFRDGTKLVPLWVNKEFQKKRSVTGKFDECHVYAVCYTAHLHTYVYIHMYVYIARHERNRRNWIQLDATSHGILGCKDFLASCR